MADATGEVKQPPLRVTFDRRLKLEFHGARITSDGGLLAYRELDDALGLTALAASLLSDGRRGRNTRHRLLGLLRQAAYGRLAGYEDLNDAARLARDPAMRAIVGREGMDRPAASTSQMGRFETEWLATEANLDVLTDLSGAWIDRVHGRKPPDGVILDLDSSESPTYGAQEGASGAPVTIRCSSSTSSATSSAAGCAPATFIAPRAGARCLSRCSPATAPVASSSTSGPTRRSPSPSCTSCWRPKRSRTPSGCRPTVSCRSGSATC
jgi:Transposase DDE domain group 1